MLELLLGLLETAANHGWTPELEHAAVVYAKGAGVELLVKENPVEYGYLVREPYDWEVNGL